MVRDVIWSPGGGLGDRRRRQGARVMLTATDFFALDDFEHAEVFPRDAWVWTALHQLKAFLAQRTRGITQRLEGDISDTARLHGEGIIIERGAVVEDGAVIHGPAVIGAGTQVRQGAYLRGQVLTGRNCVIGHATEMKHALLLNGAQAPHFNYVGDSILGAGVNLGAGTRLSNLAINSLKDGAGRRPSIRLRLLGARVDTGLAKLGAILGDGVETGCNTVTNPGCLVGPGTLIYPNVSLPAGFTPGGQLVKLRQTLQKTAIRPAAE